MAQAGGFNQGFSGAPLTRVLTGLVLLMSVFLGGGKGGEEEYSLTFGGLSNGQVWRYISGPLIFETMPETLIGLIVIYTCSTFEKQMGLRKFGAFVCIVYVINLIIQTILLVSITDYTPRSGPYFLIFALLRYYHAHIPKVRGQMFTVFNYPMSISFYKVWVYLLSLQLVFSSGFSFPKMLNSVLAASGGFLAGYFYDNSFGLHLNKYQLPLPRAAPAN